MPAVMHNMRITGNSLMALLFCACCAAGAQAAEICHTPTPQALISWYHATYPHTRLRYSAKNSLIYHPIEVFRTDHPRLNWIGLAWLSPEWGALFAANCDAKPLAAVSVGAIGKIMAGPELPELGQTVMFVYVAKETRDCVHDAAGIVALKDGKIISLWEHAYKQGMNVADGKIRLKSFITHNYAVDFGDHGQSLRVSGKIRQYAYRKDGSQSTTPFATRTLPAEIYHWNPKVLRFLPEQHYPQPGVCDADSRHLTK